MWKRKRELWRKSRESEGYNNGLEVGCAKDVGANYELGK